jgi:CRP-like cAMP-binding protein
MALARESGTSSRNSLFNIGARQSDASRARRQDVGALEPIGLVRTFARGQEIFAEGDPAEYYYKVVTGAVRLSRLLADGRRYVADFVTGGEFFGFTSQADHIYTAEALAPCTVIRYPRRGVERLIEENPALGRVLVGLVSQELSAAQDRLLSLGRKTALERVASFLLALARRRSDVAGATVELFMTREDIADHLGLRIETISRSLTQLKKERLIALPSTASVVLLRPDRLEQLAEGQLAGD